jgi:hypothetical protein
MCHHGEHHHGQDCGCEEKCTQGSCHCDQERCEGSGYYHRRYQTKAEQISVLETYLGKLKLEVQAVEERVADLRG